MEKLYYGKFPHPIKSKKKCAKKSWRMNSWHFYAKSQSQIMQFGSNDKNGAPNSVGVREGLGEKKRRGGRGR